MYIYVTQRCKMILKSCLWLGIPTKNHDIVKFCTRYTQWMQQFIQIQIHKCTFMYVHAIVFVSFGCVSGGCDSFSQYTNCLAKDCTESYRSSVFVSVLVFLSLLLPVLFYVSAFVSQPKNFFMFIYFKFFFMLE